MIVNVRSEKIHEFTQGVNEKWSNMIDEKE